MVSFSFPGRNNLSGPGTFLLWAFLPNHIIEMVGITYYPDKYEKYTDNPWFFNCCHRYWAIALPVYFCVIYVFVNVVYMSVNFLQTAPLDSMDTVTGTRSYEFEKKNSQLGDEHARIDDDERKFQIFFESDESIPPISDLSITLVNKLLYQGEKLKMS
jgi:phosphatidylinositol glycan class P protein